MIWFWSLLSESDHENILAIKNKRFDQFHENKLLLKNLLMPEFGTPMGLNFWMGKLVRVHCAEIRCTDHVPHFWSVGVYQFFFRLCISKPWICKSVVQSYSFLTATIWAAIRSKSRRPCELNLRPPLGSFSTNFNDSKDWRALRAIPPDPARQWLGELPLLRRTKIEWIVK